MRRSRSMTIRWRLALTSAALTFIILLGFALVISAFTTSRLKSDFETSLKADATNLTSRIPTREFEEGLIAIDPDKTSELVIDTAAADDAAVWLFDPTGENVELKSPAGASGDVVLPPDNSLVNIDDQACDCTYRVYTAPILAGGDPGDPQGFIMFGRQLAALNATISRVQYFLGLGVLVGTGLALLAGLAVARRAMRPISDLTYVARHVSRTRDPAVTLPRTGAKDEIADLSRTLEGMLRALDDARREAEATLLREREFVADASHELRTPLTSVLANLELLQEQLEGEDAEIAASALRSTQRMRRLVADLLFLARADTGHTVGKQSTDLAHVVADAVAETAPLAADHVMRVECPPGGIFVWGIQDDLHRLVVNLVQNALSHTPPGTIVRLRLRRKAGTMRPSTNGGELVAESVILEVSDNGPGIDEQQRERIFERFVRGGNGFSSKGSGLGLAIVGTVAASHGGTVKLTDSPEGGARFVVRLPVDGSSGALAPDEVEEQSRLAAQTSTTTGRTRGLRFRRS